jgi:hypothetical protein
LWESGANRLEIAKKLDLKWNADSVMAVAERVPPGVLRRAHQRLLETDLAAKSGGLLILERMVMAMTGGRRR